MKTSFDQETFCKVRRNRGTKERSEPMSSRAANNPEPLRLLKRLIEEEEATLVESLKLKYGGQVPAPQTRLSMQKVMDRLMAARAAALRIRASELATHR